MSQDKDKALLIDIDSLSGWTVPGIYNSSRRTNPEERKSSNIVIQPRGRPLEDETHTYPVIVTGSTPYIPSGDTVRTWR